MCARAHACAQACVNALVHREQKKASDPDVQSQADVGLGNGTQVLCKSSVCSYTLNHLLSPEFLYLRISNNVLVESHWNSLKIMLATEAITSRE